jgi:hypothetical protein
MIFNEQQAKEYMNDLLANREWRRDQEIAMNRELTEKEFQVIAENQACSLWEDCDPRSAL